MIKENILTKPEQGASSFLISEGFIFSLLMSNAFLPAYAVTALSIMYLLYYLMTSRFIIPRGIIKYLIIPLILILIGISGSIGNLPYDVLKDVWYFLNPAFVLSAGYLAMYKIRKMEQILKVFVIGGFLLALFHLFTTLSAPTLLFEASVRDIRAEKGTGYFLTLISLSIIFFDRRLNIRLFHSRYNRILIPVIIISDATSLFLSFSRTLWFSIILIFLVGSGWFALRRLKGLLIVGIIIALFQVLVLIIPKDQRDQTTMIGKIASSLDEVIVADYVTRADTQKHWRGYESYMTMKTYLSGSPLNLIIGHGFGKLVDLKIYIRLGTENFRFIPVMYNGYMYLLVKTGIIGLLLYLIYLFGFIKTGLRYSSSQDERLIFSGRFIIACTLVLFFTTFVISGMFNKGGLVPIIFLLGLLLSYVRIKSNEFGEM